MGGGGSWGRAEVGGGGGGSSWGRAEVGEGGS